MSEDTPVVVIFRKWPKSEGGDVIALFPYEDEGNYFCLSYQHVGQHGGADYRGVVASTKLATPDEYDDIKLELERIGYKLIVRKRANRRVS